jgi:hypothetical protein
LDAGDDGDATSSVAPRADLVSRRGRKGTPRKIFIRTSAFLCDLRVNYEEKRIRQKIAKATKVEKNSSFEFLCELCGLLFKASFERAALA